MLAARLSGNSNYGNPRPGRSGGCLIPVVPLPAKTSDHVANIAGGSAKGRHRRPAGLRHHSAKIPSATATLTTTIHRVAGPMSTTAMMRPNTATAGPTRRSKRFLTGSPYVPRQQIP
jgi:hypothetical protein